ncbi:squalene/phytoene synthase family protein [Xinfangfangia sp. CPCC 101601]|uniref:Squalene/phytoene synthase family protein n=1 Tax=Pseudogemmobacter lacusdianii TaxID=3069608 RepID=A0ABU0VVL9_9RHOB|nr:squalene/phytoene synthase family protein [Xinfangfangia sp. CPCC 101601]MDQ2065563.1 squalene/phytoene synthase family protein [Xinfangfangia sp. CPCC 101601]
MSLDACADLLQRGDPERHLAIMAAPPAARARLLPLYAFNLEVARAPWAAKEPLVAEMRLQWWRDVIENTAAGAARAHEVAEPLHALIREVGLPRKLLDGMVAARRWDCWREPFDDLAALEAYLEDTTGGLSWASALALGAPAGAEAAVRNYGRAAGMANFLRAVPELLSRGRKPLPDKQNVASLARLGLDWLGAARAARGSVPKVARPALLAGWQAEGILQRLAAGEPAELSEFSKRGRLLWQAFSGRW